MRFISVQKRQRRLLCFSVFFMLLFPQFLSASATESQAEICLSDLDTPLSNYIENNLPGNLATVNSTVVTNLFVTKGEKKTAHSPEEKLETTSYTFRTNQNGSRDEETYYIVLDLEFLEKMRVTENDSIRVAVNDYLRPYSPMTGVLYGRSSPDEDWMYAREITAMPASLSEISILGSQITSQYKYSRILLQIPANKNPETAETQPHYQLDYTHDATRSPLLLFLSILCAATVLPTLFWAYHRRMQTHTQPQAPNETRSAIFKKPV